MTVNLAKFVGDSASLAPAGWQKPQHVLEAIKKRKKKRALFLSSRDCGTGAGGFKPGNKCGGEGGDGGGGGIPPASDLKMTKRLGGSTGAMLAEDKNGNQFVVKGGNSASHIASESAANDIYAAAGVPVPAQQLDKLNGKTVQVSEYVPGPTLDQLDGPAFEAAAASLRENFAADALLANWDVIGLSQDNIVVPDDGRPPMRIDNGGSLDFRAQGKPKAFGPEVGELTSMRTSDQGKPIFGKLSDADVAKQITRLDRRREAILAATPEKHRKTMQARLDFMATWAKNKRALEHRRSLDRALELRNCGTGAGGFGEGNTCAKGGAGDAAATMGSGKKAGAWMEKAGYPKDLVKTVAHAKLHGVLLAKAKADGLSHKQAKAVAKATLKNALDPNMAGGPNGFTALAKQYGIDPGHPDNVLDAKGLKNDPGIYAGEKAMAAGLIKPPEPGANANVSGVNKVMPPPAPPKTPVPKPQEPPKAVPDKNAPAVQPEPTKAGPSATPGKPPPGKLPTGTNPTWKQYSENAPAMSDLQRDAIKAMPIAQEAISYYTGSEYAGLNKKLRDYASNTAGSLHELSKFDQKTALLVASLDVATRLHTHATPFEVYRGAGSSVAAQIDKLGVGEVWQDTGYVSTSTQRRYADEWGGGPDGGIAMRIVTRHGVNVSQMSQHKSESEHLLPRRSRFRLKSKEWRYVNGKPRLYVDLEHIGWHP